MLTYLKRLLTDEGAFVSLFRGAALGLGAYLLANPEVAAQIPTWVAVPVGVLVGAVRSNASTPSA